MNMYCQNCGKKLEDGQEYCLSCGASNNKNNSNGAINENNIPAEYKPISMWGYFGYEILFSLPLVGFIMLLIFSFGGTANKNLKNFARSYFCFMIVAVVLVVVLMVIFSAAAPKVPSYYY